MPGTISRISLIQQRYKFVKLLSGVEIAYHIGVNPIGAVDGAFLVCWGWDVNFTSVRNFSLDGSDPGAVKDILVSGGIYDASWVAYETGGSYVSPLDGQPYVALAATSRRFSDFCVVHSVREVLEAVSGQFGHGVLVPLVQGWMDEVMSGLIDPGAPSAPVADFPPGQIGGIGNAEATEEALGEYLTAVASGTSIVVGLAAIP